MPRIFAGLIIALGLMVLPATVKACDNGSCPAKPDPKDDQAAKPVHSQKLACEGGSCNVKPEPQDDAAKSGERTKLACEGGGCNAKPEPQDDAAKSGEGRKLACESTNCPAKPDPLIEGEGKMSKSMRASP
jgi:hypothetical protein